MIRVLDDNPWAESFEGRRGAKQSSRRIRDRVSQLHRSVVDELFETIAVRAVTFDDLIGGEPIGLA